jgi:hypothetical protein
MGKILILILEKLDLLLFINKMKIMERRPLMMEEKSDENSGALALNETVGENCFLARTTPRPV